MKFKVWLPFLLAPLIGVIIGVQLFKSEHAADTPQNDARARASEQGSGQHAPGSMPQAGGGQQTAGFSFSDVMSIMRKGGATASSAELEAAFYAVLRQPATEARSSALEAAFTRWVLDNPAHAFSHLDSIPEEDRQQIVAKALATLAQQQSEKFLSYAGTMGQSSGTVLAAAIGAISEKNPRHALELVRQNQGKEGNGELLNAILPNLIRQDLTLAAKTVASMKDDASIAQIQQVAAAYAKEDPARAYEWANEVIRSRSDSSPAQVLNEISSSLASGSPAEAANYLNRVSDPAVRKSLMGEIAIQKAQDDLTSAWNWLSQYNADASYAEAATGLLYRWSYTKPQEVARILPNIPDPEVQAAAATHLSRFWQSRDPTAYQAWVASLPQGRLKSAVSSQ